MTLTFEEIVVDCHDFRTLGHWWEAAIGWTVIDEDDGVWSCRILTVPIRRSCS
ncbi:VOC family protein [Subtercola boreus]|uniref:VOC family protein n=1 Tax=Subtercola boreus TaxID=120213 RepID=UPI001C0EFFA3|nr:VOC family protein [Subtercola boreus]